MHQSQFALLSYTCLTIMACNTCSKTFSLFRPEKGCPGCGFSYCSKCLKNKVFLQKLNSAVMVCSKCKQSTTSNNSKKIEPPDAYFKRIGGPESSTGHDGSTSEDPVEKEISERLRKLKQDKIDTKARASTDEVAERLQKLKGEVPSTSDVELTSRLANIKGVPLSALQSKLVVPTISAHKTEQEQVEDLMRQYMEQGSIDKKYEDEFDVVVSDIEARLQMLKGSKSSEPDRVSSQDNYENNEDEDDTIKKIIEKVTAEAKFENIESDPVINELPFCEICNEDAKMRCLGCKYLFCKLCFKDHEDSDDGCDKFEPYTPPNNFVM